MDIWEGVWGFKVCVLFIYENSGMGFVVLRFLKNACMKIRE